MKKTVDNEVIGVIAEQLSVGEDKVVLEASLKDDLAADSLDMAELAMAFEAKFGVEIPDEIAEKIITVSDAIRAIKDLMRSEQEKKDVRK